MSDKKNLKNNLYEFQPPKLPFGWLATTFIAPITITVLPNIFTKQEIPLTTRALIALGLLSVMLFVSCILLMLQLYNKAYIQQIIQFKLDSLTEETQLLKVKVRDHTVEIDKEIENIERKIANHE